MIEMAEIGPDQRELFDGYLEEQPGSDFRQSYGWGEVRAVDGWAPRRFVARRNGELVGAASVMAGRLPHLPFNLLYVPCGPVIDYHAPEVIGAFADLLRRLVGEASADLVRIDPPLSPEDTEAYANLAAAGFLPSRLPWSFWNAPREVIRLDLTSEEDALYRRLHKSKRQRIGAFGRKGRTVTCSRELADLLTFHTALRGLGARKGFMVREERYWHALWREFVTRDRALLHFARLGDDFLGGTFALRYGRTCYLLHAADTPPPERPTERANDPLHWATILYARRQGCAVFDMMGYVSDSHRRYKLDFGAEVTKLGAYHELVGHPARRRLFALAETHVLPWAVPFAARLTKARRKARAPIGAARAD